MFHPRPSVFIGRMSQKKLEVSGFCFLGCSVCELISTVIGDGPVQITVSLARISCLQIDRGNLIVQRKIRQNIVSLQVISNYIDCTLKNNAYVQIAISPFRPHAHGL